MFNFFNRTERLRALRQRIDDVELEINLMKKKIANLDVDLEEAKKKKRLKQDVPQEEGAVILTAEEAKALREQMTALGLNLEK